MSQQKKQKDKYVDSCILVQYSGETQYRLLQYCSHFVAQSLPPFCCAMLGFECPYTTEDYTIQWNYKSKHYVSVCHMVWDQNKSTSSTHLITNRIAKIKLRIMKHHCKGLLIVGFYDNHNVTAYALVTLTFMKDLFFSICCFSAK